MDDILLLGSHCDQIQRIKDAIDHAFTIKDLGSAKYFLGIQIARSTEGIYLCQSKYILDILRDTNMLDSTPASTPFPRDLRFTKKDKTPFFSDPALYRRLVGRLLYLGYTRPDLTYAVQQLSQFVHAPRASHWSALQHVLKYLNGARELGLFYSASTTPQVTVYTDAGWGSCDFCRHSLTGFGVFLGTSLVSWKTKKQSTLSTSTAEAEYRAMAAGVQELKWFTYLLCDLHVPVALPISFWCDNQAALYITSNPVFHERTKHIEMDCHVVRDAFKAGLISPLHVSSSHQLADLFTKSLSAGVFHFLLSKMSLWFLPQVPLEEGVKDYVNNNPEVLQKEEHSSSAVITAAAAVDNNTAPALVVDSNSIKHCIEGGIPELPFG